MTARDWLTSRDAQVPPALAARVRHALAPRADDLDVPNALLAAAVDTTRDLLSHGGTPRTAALDLLAADALLTYALQAGAESGVSLEAFSRHAMHYIGATLPQDGDQ